MSESSQHFNEEPRAKSRAEIIDVLITEALEENEVAMIAILRPGEIGSVAILGYQAGQ